MNTVTAVILPMNLGAAVDHLPDIPNPRHLEPPSFLGVAPYRPDLIDRRDFRIDPEIDRVKVIGLAGKTDPGERKEDIVLWGPLLERWIETEIEKEKETEIEIEKGIERENEKGKEIETENVIEKETEIETEIEIEKEIEKENHYPKKKNLHLVLQKSKNQSLVLILINPDLQLPLHPINQPKKLPPEIKISEIKKPEIKKPEKKKPEKKKPERKKPERKKPEIKKPEKKNYPEKKNPERKKPERKNREIRILERKEKKTVVLTVAESAVVAVAEKIGVVAVRIRAPQPKNLIVSVLDIDSSTTKLV